MTTRAQIVEEARTWKGTPWMHQQAVKGVGADCVAFIEAVALETLATGGDVSFAKDYSRSEDGATMLRLLAEHMEQIDPAEALPGDVLALIAEDLRRPSIPRHMVIVTEVRESPRTRYVIHASEHGVREHRMDAHWERRVHSAWRARGLADSNAQEQGEERGAEH